MSNVLEDPFFNSTVIVTGYFHTAKDLNDSSACVGQAKQAIWELLMDSVHFFGHCIDYTIH